MEAFIELISNMGFPTAFCIAMFVLLFKEVNVIGSLKEKFAKLYEHISTKKDNDENG